MIERILPILALLAAFALFFGYVQPTYSGTIDSLSTQVSQYESALQAASQYDARQAELTRQRDALPTDQLARIQSFLPDGVDNVRLILDLNALAARSGVVLSGFSIDNKSAAGGSAPANSGLQLASASPTDSLDLTVTATGTYGAFRTFLKGVETSLRPIDITALDVKSSATGVYTYGVTMRVYWLR